MPFVNVEARHFRAGGNDERLFRLVAACKQQPAIFIASDHPVRPPGINGAGVSGALTSFMGILYCCSAGLRMDRRLRWWCGLGLLGLGRGLPTHG